MMGGDSADSSLYKGLKPLALALLASSSSADGNIAAIETCTRAVDCPSSSPNDVDDAEEIEGTAIGGGGAGGFLSGGAGTAEFLKYNGPSSKGDSKRLTFIRNIFSLRCCSLSRWKRGGVCQGYSR